MVKKISLIYGSERFFDICNENLIISIAFTRDFAISLHRKPITRRKFTFGIKIFVTNFSKGRKRTIFRNTEQIYKKTMKNRKESEYFSQQKRALK